MSNAIGELNEKPLHAALKAWLAQPGDALEAPVDGYVIDLIHGTQLIEIQTGGFTPLKGKLAALLPQHPVRVVFPVAEEKWIVRLTPDGEVLGRRKSPRRGDVLDAFAPLVSIARLAAHPNFSLEVLLIREEERRLPDARRGWRRGGWVIHERRLLDVVRGQRFETLAAFAALLPEALPQPFTTADLAAALGRPRSFAGRMTYCLREMGALIPAGRRGRSLLYFTQ